MPVSQLVCSPGMWGRVIKMPAADLCGTTWVADSLEDTILREFIDGVECWHASQV